MTNKKLTMNPFAASISEDIRLVRKMILICREGVNFSAFCLN